jgi:predicted methyltransferase MtxX (methanogen marker protein 4)
MATKNKVVIHVAEINYKALGRKRPHDELLTEAEAIVEHIKRNTKKRKVKNTGEPK